MRELCVRVAALSLGLLAGNHEFGRGPIPGLVREKARAAPELVEVIDDLSVIEKHRGMAVIVGSGVEMLAWSSWMR